MQKSKFQAIAPALARIGGDGIYLVFGSERYYLDALSSEPGVGPTLFSAVKSDGIDAEEGCVAAAVILETNAKTLSDDLLVARRLMRTGGHLFSFILDDQTKKTILDSGFSKLGDLHLTTGAADGSVTGDLYVATKFEFPSENKPEFQSEKNVEKPSEDQPEKAERQEESAEKIEREKPSSKK